LITCPVCSYAENTDGATVCIRCGSVLPDTRITILKRHTSILSPEKVEAQSKVRDKHKGTLQRTDIAVYFGELDEPVIIPLAKDLLLGRGSGTDQEPADLLDLAAFGAIENGVSRKHALLHRLGPDIVAIDQGSTNGTWLNGVRLNPAQPVTLRSGDRLLLARLQLQIYLP